MGNMSKGKKQLMQCQDKKWEPRLQSETKEKYIEKKPYSKVIFVIMEEKWCYEIILNIMVFN